jgi:transcriptional regulator
MYIPDAFAVADEATLADFIAANGFAALVTTGPDGPVASHVPVVYERERKVLELHVAAANPHARVADGERALAIFAGPHGYVSPSWYATHPAVPTWNYAAVHVSGRMARITRPERLRALLAKLVAAYEPRGSSWKMGALSAEYMAKMLAGIVGFEIAVERIEGKFKLSQNRDAADRRRVIAAPADSARIDDRTLAEFMARHAAPPG